MLDEDVLVMEGAEGTFDLPVAEPVRRIDVEDDGGEPERDAEMTCAPGDCRALGEDAVRGPCTIVSP